MRVLRPARRILLLVYQNVVGALLVPGSNKRTFVPLCAGGLCLVFEHLGQ